MTMIDKDWLKAETYPHLKMIKINVVRRAFPTKESLVQMGPK